MISQDVICVSTSSRLVNKNMKKSCANFPQIFFRAVIVLCFCWFGCTDKEAPIYERYTVAVAPEKMPSSGYGVILKQENGKIYCLSAAHLFDKLFEKYYIILSNGKSREVIHVRKISGSDLAVVEIDSSGLKEKRDYEVPDFSRDTTLFKNRELCIFNDGYYRIPFRKMADADDRVIYLPGKIEKGRSGSPLFIKGYPVCVGIVSGYYPEESKYGEKIVVEMPEQEYCSENIDLSIQEKISIWEKIWKMFRSFFRMIADQF